ncbi:hypothetical protein KGG72_gp82 [Streptomyces phage Salutena]|uniref:Uncharacterized protein n=1 Tax=Streptomyces phage Salutena TaxID=2767576 RepID=A0A7S6TXA8_9CAUD|nr:hypothetical protein KGG72_gp82 [Streptomyces phage Salutena]QOV06212.1 hypothetical protein CPT_Salutena_082 [Streptomyces phage Salutena]
MAVGNHARTGSYPTPLASVNVTRPTLDSRAAERYSRARSAAFGPKGPALARTAASGPSAGPETCSDLHGLTSAVQVVQGSVCRHNGTPQGRPARHLHNRPQACTVGTSTTDQRVSEPGYRCTGERTASGGKRLTCTRNVERSASCTTHSDCDTVATALRTSGHAARGLERSGRTGLGTWPGRLTCHPVSEHSRAPGKRNPGEDDPPPRRWAATRTTANLLGTAALGRSVEAEFLAPLVGVHQQRQECRQAE